MRRALMVSALLLSNLPARCFAAASGPTQEEQGIVAEFRRVLNAHNDEYLRYLVQRLKQRNPQPAVLINVSNLLAEKGAGEHLEPLAMLISREVFQQLSASAQQQIRYFKLKHLERAYPRRAEKIAESFSSRGQFFAAIRDAIRVRDECSFELLEVLVTVDTTFLDEDAQASLLNITSREERRFVLSLLLELKLLTPKLRSLLQKHTAEDIAFVEEQQRNAKGQRRFDEHLDVHVRGRKNSLITSNIVDPNRGYRNLHPSQREEYARALAQVVDEAQLAITPELNDRVEQALTSAELYTITLTQAVLDHDYALLLPLVLKGRHYFTPQAIPLLMELSAQAQNPFLIHMCIADLLEEFPHLWDKFSQPTSKYILGVLTSESLAEEMVGSYFASLSDEHYAAETRSHSQVVDEIKPGLRDFLVDPSNYPYLLRDVEVLSRYLRGQLKQGKLLPFNRDSVGAACVTWDAELRQKRLVPCMRAGI